MLEYLNKETGKYECKVCEYKGARASVYHHMKSIHENRVFPCNDCGLKLSTNSALKSHKRSFHEENIEMFSCNQCEATFKSSDGKLRHIQVKHQNIKYI